MVATTKYPFRLLPSAKRRPFLGVIVTILGWTPAWLGMIGNIALLYWLGWNFSDPNKSWIFFGFNIFIALSFFLFYPLWLKLQIIGPRMRELDALTLLERDYRPPVLYLRSFGDDDLPDVTLSTWASTYEMQLCQVLRDIGPVVAIGRPGEAFPERGAARFYVSNDEWRDAVKYFLAHSAAVVFIVGKSDGVLWEIETALKQISPEKLLFFFPYGLKKERRNTWLAYRRLIRNYSFQPDVVKEMEQDQHERYQLFRQNITTFWPYELPAALEDAAFLTFLPDGKAQPLKTKRAPLITRASDRLKININFQRTLRPFLERHLKRQIAPSFTERIFATRRNMIILLVLMIGSYFGSLCLYVILVRDSFPAFHFFCVPFLFIMTLFLLSNIIFFRDEN